MYREWMKSLQVKQKDAINSCFEEEQKEWDLTIKSQKWLFGLAFELGSFWAAREISKIEKTKKEQKAI